VTIDNAIVQPSERKFAAMLKFPADFVDCEVEVVGEVPGRTGCVIVCEVGCELPLLGNNDPVLDADLSEGL